MFLELLFLFYAFIFGAMMGSFSNVIIYRIPLGMNIAIPRSHCPKCLKKVSWFNNIPIFSYLFLKGKCSHCRVKISVRYLAVEIIAAVVSVLLYLKCYQLSSFVMYFFYFSIFIIFLCHFIIDLDHMILPDSLNLILGAILFAYSLLHFDWQYWLLGLSVGLFIPYLVTWIYYKIKGVVGLGGGDIKLYGALGLYLGPYGIIQNIFLSCLFGSIIGIVFILIGKMKKENPLPFGPFIIVVASLQIFLSDEFNQLLALIF